MSFPKGFRLAWIEQTKHKHERAGQWIWFTSWFIITAIGLYLRPDVHGHGTHQQLGLPPCPSVLLFNRPCPGCGMTTSWTSLLHGDVAGAFRANWIGPVLYLIFSATAILSAVGAMKGFRIATEDRAVNRFTIAVAIVFFSYAIARFSLTSNYGSGREIQMAQFIGLRKG